MRYDILFHVTTLQNFDKSKADGNFKPESLETKGSIPCAGGNQIEAVANKLFSGNQRILLLVIDVSTLRPEVKYEENKDTGIKLPYIKGPINTDAIIDKIEIQPEENGDFEISYNSYS